MDAITQMAFRMGSLEYLDKLPLTVVARKYQNFAQVLLNERKFMAALANKKVGK